MAADGGQAAGEKREKPKGQEDKIQEKEKVNGDSEVGGEELKKECKSWQRKMKNLTVR